MKHGVIFGFLGSVVLMVGVVLYGTLASIEFSVNCKGYLKRAADANTVQIAKEELGKAISYIEENSLDSGSTHWLYRSPSTDMGFWYKNLKASFDELGEFPEDAGSLVVSNQLMKLRETLLDDGASVTHPPNISVFPNQFVFNVLLLLATCGTCLLGFALPLID